MSEFELENPIDLELSEMDLEFDISAFDCDFDLDDKIETGFCKPKVLKQKHIAYDKAVKLAEDIELEKNANYYAIVSGNFIFGDLLEALILNKKLSVKNLFISTLSMSENNIDSLVNIMQSGQVEKLHLLVSSYFFAHERHNLIPYIHEELDNKEWSFLFCVAGSHTKLCLIELTNGLKITIHGSANMRSSGNIEQIAITENEELYEFNKIFLEKIEENYLINKKSELRGNELWLQVAEHSQK